MHQSHYSVCWSAINKTSLFKYSKATIAIIAALSGPLAIAGTTSQSVTFNSVGQSMWGSGESIAFSNLDDPLFLGTSWDESGRILKLGDPTAGGNGVEVRGSTDGRVGLELGWNINSGTINSSLPFNFTLDTPDREDLDGSSFQFGVTAASLSRGAFIRTVSPTLQAYADLVFEMNASLTAKGCYNALFTSDCGSKTLDIVRIDNSTSTLGRELMSVNIGGDRDKAEADGEIRVLDGFKSFIAAGSSAAKLANDLNKDNGVDKSGNPDDSAPPPKTAKTNVAPKPKVSAGLSELASVGAKLPEIDALGKTSSDQAMGGGGKSRVISTSASDEFLSVDFDVDTAGTLIGISPPLGVEASVDFGIGSVGASIDLIDVTLSPSLSLTQDLSLSINNIGVTYEFDDGRASQRAASLTDLITVDWNGNAVGITPVYDIAATVTNSTGLSIDFGLNIDLLKGSAAAEVLGFDLGGAKFGPLASLSADLGSIAIPSVYDNTFGLGGFGSVKGSKINVAIAEATFRFPKGDWSSRIYDTWAGTGQFVDPNSSTDVSIGTDARASYVLIRGVDNNGVNQTARAGNISILNADSRLDVGGNPAGAPTDNGTRMRLHSFGTSFYNEGEINVFTRDTLGFGASNIDLSGSGYISLQDGGALEGFDGPTTLNVSGQDIYASSLSNTSYVNNIFNLNINLDNGADLIDYSGTRLALVNSNVNNLGTADVLRGTVGLTSSTLTNFDIVGNLNVLNTGATIPNFSALNSGADGVIVNNGTITVQGDSNGNSQSRSVLSINNGTNSLQAVNLVNEGTIELSKAFVGGDSFLNISRNTTLSGNGEIRLNHQDAAITLATGQTLINGESHTIEGIGRISTATFATLDNRGTIIANGGVNQRLDLSSLTLRNTGTLSASGGSSVEMLIDGQKLVNASLTSGGTFILGEGHYSVDQGTSFDGSNIVFKTGNINVNHFINRAEISLTGTRSALRVKSNAASVGTNIDSLQKFTNEGTINLKNALFGLATGGSGGVNSVLRLLNKGDIIMDNSTVFGLINDTNALVEGTGTFSAFGNTSETIVDNKGTIRAKNGLLNLDIPNSARITFNNTGNIEAVDGELSVNFRTRFNVNDVFAGGGTWGAYADNQAATIRIRTLGSDVGITELRDTNIVLSGSDARIITTDDRFLPAKDTALQTTLTRINGDASLTLANNQVFSLSKALTNTGQINLQDATLGFNQTLTNSGSIVGHGTITGATLDNNGVLRAQGGTMQLHQRTDNRGGVIEVGSGSRNATGDIGDAMQLVSNTIDGGEIVIKENAVFSGNGQLDAVKLTNRGTVTNSPAGSLSIQLADGSTNTGALGASNGGNLALGRRDLDNTNGQVFANDAKLRLDGITILNGQVEIIGAEAALRGYGSLDNVEIKVANGSIIADVNGQRLTLTPSEAAQLINATLMATNGGILRLADGNIKGSGGTVIRAENGSIVELKNINISGSEFQTFGTGKFVDIASSNFTNMNFTGNMEVASGGEFNLNGSNSLSGSLTALAGGEIILHDSTLVGQTLESVVNSDGSITITTLSTPGDLTIASGASLHGSGGLLNLNIVNQGLISANDGGTLEVDNAGNQFVNNGSLKAENASTLSMLDNSVVNQGEINVETGSTMDFAQTLEQTSGSTTVDGRMAGGTLIISDGTLSGLGSIAANVEISQQGLLFESGLPDKLNIEGNVSMASTMSIDLFDLNDFDSLTVLGDFTFTSTSQFVFNFADDFEFFDGLSFNFIVASAFEGFESFNMANVSFNGLSSRFAWEIGLNDLFNGVDLSFSERTSSVSEPSTIAMLLGTLLMLLVRRRHVIPKLH